MPTFVIERTIPGAGGFTEEKWQEIAARSNATIAEYAPEATWLHSYVTDDKLYCVYDAPTADPIHTHAQCGGFPADAVNEVTLMIDPLTGV